MEANSSYYIETLKNEISHLRFRRKELKRKLRETKNHTYQQTIRDNILKYDARLFEIRKLLQIFDKTIAKEQS